MNMESHLLKTGGGKQIYLSNASLMMKIFTKGEVH